MSTEPELLIGSFIFDQTHQETGIVEELKDGLVRYSIRSGLGSSRDRQHWTIERACYVLLEQGPQEDRHERLLNDMFAGLGCFIRGERGALLWEDMDGKTHRVRLDVDD